MPDKRVSDEHDGCDFHLNCETNCDHVCHNMKIEIAQLRAQLASKDAESNILSNAITALKAQLDETRNKTTYKAYKSLSEQLGAAEAKIQLVKEMLEGTSDIVKKARIREALKDA